MNDELNRFVHEKVLGKCWHEFSGLPDNPAYKTPICDHCEQFIDTAENPDYTSSLDAVAEAERVVVEKFGAQKYGQYLLSVVTDIHLVAEYGFSDTPAIGWQNITKLVTASAEQRCGAIKALFGGENDEC